ncbi:hypothetical protein CC78DRAFT_573203 [Lojkania enalia]|uniref:Major facilitator superfamily transporter n=1 Tax=Lojkania enalia TaxID=147567 RepID=A0A9P4TQU0_9PLEO|nr:hypothetical protein CC78DRAFT_573203 [Didymosphaeria enalia]
MTVEESRASFDSSSCRPRNASPMGPHPRRISIWPLLFLLILVNMATNLYKLPLNRVIEKRLCEEHYSRHEPGKINPDGSIPEKLCKIDDVQRQLGWLQGIMETTFVVCDFLVTIPFSFVAEKFGIKVVLWCNLVPLIVMPLWALVVGNFPHILPTRAIIASPFWALLGGECVFNSAIFTLTSSLAQEYVQRSDYKIIERATQSAYILNSASYFSYVNSISYVVAFIGPSLASFTMNRNLWLPFWISIALLIMGIPIIKMLPEANKAMPLPIPRSEDNDADEAGPLLAERSPSPSRYYNAFETPKSAFQDILQVARKLIRLITGRRNFQILLLSFFLTALASSDTKLLVQYISKRYDWTFAQVSPVTTLRIRQQNPTTSETQAGYLLSAKALVNIFLLAIIVPRLIRTTITSKPVHGSEVRLNYLAAESSIAISVLGALIIALASKFWMLLAALIIYALGSALPVFTMSLVKSPLIALTDSEIQDFSIVMLTKTLGSLVGAPLMAFLWVRGIGVGELGLGLPFFVSAVVYLLAAFVVARLEF